MGLVEHWRERQADASVALACGWSIVAIDIDEENADIADALRAMVTLFLGVSPLTLFVEMKYTEACQGPPARHRARYDEASREVALHRDPDAPALRSVMLEQFWRLHLLADLSVRHGQTPRAHLLVLYPRLNRHVRTATRLYANELKSSDDARTGFSALTLETFVTALRAAGAEAQAGYIYDRYLDLTAVLDLVLAESTPTDPTAASVATMLALPAPGTHTATPVPRSASGKTATTPRRRDRTPTAVSSPKVPSRRNTAKVAPFTRPKAKTASAKIASATPAPSAPEARRGNLERIIE